jgi:hypothetical protein
MLQCITPILLLKLNVCKHACQRRLKQNLLFKKICATQKKNIYIMNMLQFVSIQYIFMCYQNNIEFTK